MSTARNVGRWKVGIIFYSSHINTRLAPDRLQVGNSGPFSVAALKMRPRLGPIRRGTRVRRGPGFGLHGACSFVMAWRHRRAKARAILRPRSARGAVLLKARLRFPNFHSRAVVVVRSNRVGDPVAGDRSRRDANSANWRRKPRICRPPQAPFPWSGQRRRRTALPCGTDRGMSC